MIILHAGFLDERPLLWGESPLKGTARPASRRGGKTKAGRPQAFPFDAGATRLLSALERAGVSAPGGGERIETAIAWLPTVGGAPVPSSPLIAEIPDSSTPPALSPWTVTVLPLDPERATTLLSTSVGKQMLAPGVVVGRDLAFWARAMRFAGALVARQQFLPGLESRNGRYRAVWEPVVVGEDRGRVTALANDMPGIARALSSQVITSPPVAPPQSVLALFLGGMMDHLIRVSGSTPPLASAGHRRGRGKAADFASLHDQWLNALRSPDGILRVKRQPWPSWPRRSGNGAAPSP